MKYGSRVVSQLTTNHSCILDTPEVITDSAPPSVHQHFHPSLAWVRPVHQTYSAFVGRLPLTYGNEDRDIPCPMNKLFQGEVRLEFSCSLINGINCMRDSRLSLYPCYQRDPVNKFIPSQLDPVYQCVSLNEIQFSNVYLSTGSSVLCVSLKDAVYQYTSLNQIQCINVSLLTRSSVSMCLY